MLLIRLVLCVICPAALSSNVHSVLPESDDRKINDGDEYGVRNYVSDHELPRDVPTRVKIVGDLGTPPPSVKLDFVPQQTYVQVRRYDAVKRLPQEAAMEEAATSEEMANAPRLREVVTHKKTQEVYEEQGYEDAGYDHGGSKKLKIEEEVKDNQSVEVFGPKNSSSQNVEETKDHLATVAPSGRGTWSRHKTTTGKKTRYEDDGDKRKVIINDSNPISEKSSGNYSKFDGGKIIVVQNLTQSEKKDSKNEGAESRRVPSFSKTKDNVEPTTYRPIMRHDSSRNTVKQNKNDNTNRTRSRPRKHQKQESDVQKSQTDVIGSYDNSPWIPISPPTDYKRNNNVNKKPVKSKMNSELHELNGHSTKYGYSINHDTAPYQYVFPTDVLTPGSSNKPDRKSRPKLENLGVTDRKPQVSSYSNYEFIPQTNYDGSAINSKHKKIKKSSGENFSFDTINLPSNLKTGISHNINKQNGSASNQRQKKKTVQSGPSENFNINFKIEPQQEKKKKNHRDIETELGNRGNSGSRYTGSIVQDVSPPKTYDAPFITRLKKNNYDSRGDPTIRVYPKYEFYPNYQNVQHHLNDEIHHGQRPLNNMNSGHASIESNHSPPHSIKHDSSRLSEYSKFNNRPKNIYKQSDEPSGSWENYPKIRGQTSQLSEDNYSKFNKGDGYPTYESNKRYEGSGTKSSSIYRLIPYEKSVKMNNPYSYVYHDDHYPSGSRYSGVKVEITTQSPKLSDRNVYWNSRHPHLPKDSIKNTEELRGRDKSEYENTRHVENLTLAHFSGHHKSGSYRPLPIQYNERVNNLAKLLNDNYPRRTRRDLEVINIASSGTTTEIPVDTVVYPHYKKAPKQSALRYATNPILTPRKTAGGMEFYASTDNVRCTDMSAPTDIVPKRTEDGEWKGEPSNNNPRVDALGDKIGCFKTKYFGSDPLDNPIFKEKDVGFPDVLFTVKKSPEKEKDDIQSGKPHANWNFADELISDHWFPSKDVRSRR
ncbi:hypothetical protein AGLY_007078 [Aphis glycines]|uniref:Uncharacterized protein n=1 Tax=Aphis glycines TaxID=307491 RepID=A0A6G0TQ19_APHGL|nr:hypothetical protein AGLY_007078 [Aphis glycines]